LLGVELLPALALAAGGVVAGFINVVAAGGSLITLPLLIFLGIPPTSANGTVRIAILVQGLTATLRFHRAKVIDWKTVPKIVGPVWVGAIGGAIVASNMADTNFKAMIGWITLVAGGIVAIDLKKFLANRQARPSMARTIIFMVAMLIVGFYGGLAQAGVGYLFLASLVMAGGYSLVDANIMKVVLIMAFTPFAILVFGLNAKIHIGYALVLAAGQAFGAHFGAGITLSKGASIIRPMLVTVVVAAAIKLLFF